MFRLGAMVNVVGMEFAWGWKNSLSLKFFKGSRYGWEGHCGEDIDLKS